ncbi:expansin-like A1 [Cryptomeria japonica]|uniref:expansin-like A1 n=1 Tax=Cryptomeria japonica TaxID=3369 RepID=UPI0027D9FA72|nr:expansin-like A1 [Cryptomeria japonica]
MLIRCLPSHGSLAFYFPIKPCIHSLLSITETYVIMELKTVCFAGWILMFIIPTVFCFDRCLYKSKVAYYASSEAANMGACGYESFASTMSNGDVASASPKIYREGIGCGGCYQIRCTDPEICTKSGVKVLVTDFPENTQTDFVLPRSTFSKLAQPAKCSQLLNRGIVDIEYERIPCEYPGQNMMVQIGKISSPPYFLAVLFQYQGGQTDILGVDVAQAGSSNWKHMMHNYGAVWSLDQPPEGALSLQLFVATGYNGSVLVSPKEAVLPANWSVRSVYDTGVQIDKIKQVDCPPCATKDWDGNVYGAN